MADYIQMLIEILRIDCNVVQCYYTNQIDAIFNLFFFPTVFILLIIYLILQYVLDEVRGGLRLLISIALYAVIVINGLMTLFIPLSQFWWIILILIVGAWAFFFRLLFREKKGGSKGPLVGAMAGGAVGGMVGYMAGKAKGDVKKIRGDIERGLTMMRNAARGVKSVDASKGGDPGKSLEALQAAHQYTDTSIDKLEAVGELDGWRVFEKKDVEEYRNKMNKILEDAGIGK
jgi:hypothetical protein